MAYMPTLKEAYFSFSSLKDFQDAALAEQVLQAINEAGKDFIPDVYGEDEVLAKIKYDPAHLDSLIRHWTDEGDGATVTQRSFASCWLASLDNGKHTIE